jgi:2-methylcitrate dehydratase PrpD
MLEGITEKIVDFAINTRFEDLPREVVDALNKMVLDSIGCALAGHVVDRGKLAVELVEEFGGYPRASIIGAHRTSLASAAFANGELINALDYDYIGPLFPHVCPFVFPSCLAVAEDVHATGKEFILALALAHEIGGRIGLSLTPGKVLKNEPPYYEEWPRSSQAYTFFGGVAGAGKLLGLNANKMSNAFGIAGASAPVPAETKNSKNSGPKIMLKYNSWSGWASQLATVATLLANKGFTGDTTILDGEWGFWKIVAAPSFNVDILLGGLGETWHVADIGFKFYPTCVLNHLGLEGINRIMDQHGIKPEDIEEIVVKADSFLLTPDRAGTYVRSFADVQFVNSYIFAIGAYYGRSPSPAWQMPAIYNNPKVKTLAGKVKVELHPRTDEFTMGNLKSGGWPHFSDTIVEITAKGRKFSTEVLPAEGTSKLFQFEATSPRGNRANPRLKEDLIDKFRNNAAYSALSTGKIEHIIEMVENLEELDDINKLTKLLVVS